MPRPAPAAPTRDEPIATGDKRQAVLDAALTLMVERGFHGTAMPQVAAQARVGVGTIYRYFADKEQLGNALYREGKQALAAALWGEPLPDLGFEAQFKDVWRRLAAFARSRTLMLRFLELHYHASYLDAESLALEQSALEPANAYLRTAIAAGAVRDLPPELLGAMVWAMLIAVCAEPATLAQPDLVAAAGDCAWAAIRRPASADSITDRRKT